MAVSERLSVYLCFLLRHRPEEAGLEMDHHGWVSVSQLIRGVNDSGKFKLDRELLERIVAEDGKGRYRFNREHTRIKACQGHSIPWVEPELEQATPPEYLYHGTTTRALELIYQSGGISKMKRHAVHMQAEEAKAWQSARRWRNQRPVVLKLAARRMEADGFSFGVTENGVWCTESVPVAYLVEAIYE